MNEDIGSQDDIIRMTEEREVLLRGHLKSAFFAEFKSYFNSMKSVILLGITLSVYLFARWTAFHPSWLVLAAMGLSFVPLLYLLIIGTKNGYLRTVTSKRKTSLVNYLMFRISLPRYIGVWIGFFSSATFSSLFSDAPSGSGVSNGIIQLLGYGGLSIIVAIFIVYIISYVKLANTDYRRLIQLVSHSKS